MPYLITVSFIWALSFGLIKGRLVGLDSAFITSARLGLALRGLQFGLMYLAYNQSFRHLKAYEVALLTLTTPVMVTLLADALERRWRPRALLAALLAVAGAGLGVFHGQVSAPALAGVAWVQLSNLAFAAGEIGYRRWRQAVPGLRDRDVFAWLYLGGTLVALLVLGVGGGVPASLNASQAMTLLYLGAVASGLGFFLWNVGATRVGPGTLAVMNNAKIPLAVACSLLVFGERADPLRLAASLALLGAAVWLAERRAA